MPKLISTPVSGGRHTHKNWWDCKTGIAYLVYDGKQIGWRSNRLVWIVDLSDPYHPQTIRQFGLRGHEPGSNQNTVPPGAHEATLSPNGDRLFVAYGTGSDGVMQIVNIKKLLACRPHCPQQPTSEEMRYPQVGRLDMPGYWGGHTAWPLMGMELPEHVKFRNDSPRNFVVLVSEAFSHKCRGDSHDMVFMVDISDESVPFSVANYQVKESSGNYCQRGGRFGAHSVAWSYNTPYYKKIIAISYFNAGLRLVDVRDPFHLKEVGFYIPSKNRNSSLSAIQTNNVEIDDRGYIYLVDRSHSGLHIVEVAATLRKSLQ